MHAGTGSMHSELLTAVESIQSGIMPPATQALRHYDFELQHGVRSYQLRFLDYPGELFRKVFYDMAVDSDESRELYNASIAADGVIVLADPRSIVDGTWDIDYAMTNLLRFYDTNGRKRPQIVLAFTKRDETYMLVKRSITAFVRSHLPHLWDTLRRGMRLMHFSSITKSANGVELASPQVVAAPLKAVIAAIEAKHAASNRRRHIRWLKWNLVAGRCALVVLMALTILVAFIIGVRCRHRVNSSPPNHVSEVNPV